MMVKCGQIYSFFVCDWNILLHLLYSSIDTYWNIAGGEEKKLEISICPWFTGLRKEKKEERKKLKNHNNCQTNKIHALNDESNKIKKQITLNINIIKEMVPDINVPTINTLKPN